MPSSKGAKDQLVVGKRIYSDLQAHERQSVLSYLVAVTTLALYVGWMNWLILLGVTAIWKPWARYLLVALWGTTFLPAKPVLWTWFCQLWVFKTWREYFRYSFSFDELLDPHKRYILYEAPHGTFPIGPITAGTLVQTLFPETRIFSVAATSVFTIPFWRHFISWIGSLPATKHNFKKLLKHGSVAVVVGGIAEMYMCDPRRERIKLQGRKGFVRVALEEQIDGIVPVYYFGNSRALNFGPAFLADLSRKIRVSLGVLHGVLGLPIPFPVEMYLVHGKVIPVPKVSRDDPEFEKHVDELHAVAVKGMQDLYEKHRAEYGLTNPGWAERPLSIE